MLSKFSVKKPYTVVVTVVLILILGFVSFTEMTTDLLPSIDLPYVVVVTSYIGASPEEIEEVVTKPIEQSMATVSNIKEISSTSSENVSMVMLEFTDGTNMDSVSLDVREKLDLIEGYWSDSVGAPMIIKINPNMMPVMVTAIDGENMTPEEVTQYTEDKIIPQLEALAGVASVTPMGMYEKQLNVVINQDKIDSINEKLKDHVEEQLEDGKDKLDDAKVEISEGKQELNQKKAEFEEGMIQGEQGITDARLELLKKEIELAKSEEELQAKEDELLASEKELNEQEKTLLEGEKTLLANEKEANDSLDVIKEQELVLTETIEQLTTTKSNLEQTIKDTENSTQLTIEEKETALLTLNSQLAEVSTGLENALASQTTMQESKAQLESGLKEIATKKEEIATGKTAIASGKVKIAEGKAALASAKQQMSAGKEQLEEGKTQIDEKEKELAKTKSTVSSELNSAESELKAGEKELTNQLDQFDDTKEDALSQATIEDKITTDMIQQILKAQNFSMPAGYVTEDGTDYMVRVGNKIEDEEEMKNLILFDLDIEDMEPVTLQDVADVFWSDNLENIYAKVNDNNGIILSMQKQTTYSTAEVANRINVKFTDIMNENENIHVNNLMDQGMYIDLVVNSVLNNLIMGGILAVIILLLFLRDLKPTFIIACSIPISVVFAIVLMYFSGVTLNIISLSGLAVGVGMLVDNSVVVIENIYRLRSKGISAAKAAVNGAAQVGGAIIASTLTTVCVFLPIVFVKGITRELFTDMALTIGYSLLASLIVALTLVPAMSSSLLKSTKEKQHKFFELFVGGYERLLRTALRWKPIVLVGIIGLLIISIFGAVSNGTAFMPDMDSTQITVTMQMPEGSKKEDTVKMSDAVIEEIRKIKEVDVVGAMFSLGQASSLGLSSVNDASTDAVDMYVILKENKKRTSQEIAKEIEEKCAAFDCELTVSGSSMDLSVLGGTGIQIQIKGLELDELRSIAEDVAAKLATIKGTADVSSGLEEPAPELRIVINKEKAMLKGLTVAQAYMEIQTMLADSAEATTLSVDGNSYSVLVDTDLSKELVRDDIRTHEFEVTDAKGEKKLVKLKDIAEITDTVGFSEINRASQQRYITVSAEIAEGYNVGLVSREVTKAFKDYKVPSGYEIEYNGENENINDSLGELGKMLLLAVAFIYLIMVAQFQSLGSPFIVLFTIPLAFTGGFLGLWMTGNEISVIGMIGFVMLSGIIVNNGIVLVDYTNQLRQEGITKKEAIVEACVTRMRPVLMTALTTILGLSTMAVGVGMGSDMMQPIAIVTIGGLLYGTITTLFVIPVLYDILNRKEMKVLREQDLVLLEDEDE
ncbi:efflux RND transporter permease subunit [Anaeromicropila populeti]|uniref:Multidrug efflux pump subunit AcrB n=1 Tax=Anaeromicropila populeti TaxID=37658 RepID=A0A1I6JZF0_9FIRM|nr:efflux RND transporter permease subunit [Anaeromicropila populeti]SFR84362.1 Multidrug efflux pump subunit AcrB [Anaeromicropila populeti]